MSISAVNTTKTYSFNLVVNTITFICFPNRCRRLAKELEGSHTQPEKSRSGAYHARRPCRGLIAIGSRNAKTALTTGQTPWKLTKIDSPGFWEACTPSPVYVSASPTQFSRFLWRSTPRGAWSHYYAFTTNSLTTFNSEWPFRRRSLSDLIWSDLICWGWY